MYTRGHPDMMSASEGEGVHGKVDVVRGGLPEIYCVNQFQMRTRGRG